MQGISAWIGVRAVIRGQKGPVMQDLLRSGEI